MRNLITLTRYIGYRSFYGTYFTLQGVFIKPTDEWMIANETVIENLENFTKWIDEYLENFTKWTDKYLENFTKWTDEFLENFTKWTDEYLENFTKWTDEYTN